MAPLTATELRQHPEFEHINWDLKPSKREQVSVASGRGGPFKLAYEIHGHGPHHMLFVMGLGGFKENWQRQTKEFGHVQGDKYSSLIYDNRGMGGSDVPLLRYTTSEMARDAVELLDHVGWTERRSIHVIGISMGGMIAQELGLLVPERICSLNLISTAPRIVRTLPYFENLRNRINLLRPKGMDAQIAKVKVDCYSLAWLEKPDDTDFVAEPFPTNGDRFAAGEVWKRSVSGRFTRTGFLCQLLAAGWHHKSDAQLQKLGDEVGRERILVFHGTVDRMIDFAHAKMLYDGLGGEGSGVTKSFHEGIGHVGPIEIRKEFNKLIEERIAVTDAMEKE
ncbi:alpha/beta-hydrolase [Polychaeton citri CBS 116435]|uniref:Alpha/beta-hydrolase n=1 Tax=Polychaeton citri CBS 116435 TaxID=1314669 RepID=A0A9P4Q0H2_9PEZI|nr:alpha/beta-hydrolase [Polychaeton citri CBS 116435]